MFSGACISTVIVIALCVHKGKSFWWFILSSCRKSVHLIYVARTINLLNKTRFIGPFCDRIQHQASLFCSSILVTDGFFQSIPELIAQCCPDRCSWGRRLILERLPNWKSPGRYLIKIMIGAIEIEESNGVNIKDL